MVTVGLADDHIVVRQGLRLLLETDPSLTVVGEAADGNEALKLVKSLKPQVLVLDLMMPTPDGLEVLRTLSRLKSPHAGDHPHDVRRRGLPDGCAQERRGRVCGEGVVRHGPPASHP